MKTTTPPENAARAIREALVLLAEARLTLLAAHLPALAAVVGVASVQVAATLRSLVVAQRAPPDRTGGA